MTVRIGEAKHKPGALAVCLMAWARHDEDIDARAGVFVVAETVIMVRRYLTGGKA